ncbi:unnamed protein product [Rhizoctonia solani]|uniref:Uncharacterized protein n=1 Tax=Rhizoctonia solani TaxID=456999 RepID=A0A8H3I1A9_9AGAM|nr:unnamed protein product [Rhizoctonia solani]
MPGPSSPLRKKNAQVAKSKARGSDSKWRPPPINYKPNSDSAVWTLPTYLTDEEKSWWNQYAGKGKEFDSHLARRGSHNGAANWARGKFCEEWWPKYRGDFDLPEMEKLYYYARLDVGSQIYSHLHNQTTRDSTGNPENGGDPIATGTSKKNPRKPPKIPKLKKKVIAHDHWRRSNLGIYKIHVDSYTSKFGKPSLAKQRILSYEAFKGLSPGEQAEWEKRAQDAIEASREAAKITDPEERARFFGAYMKEFRQMLEDLEAVTGAKMCAMILHQTPEGSYKIDRELSGGIKAFGKAPALASAMGAFQKWYQDSAGATVDNPIPLPTVYPDYANEGYPLLPNFTGLGLDPARHLMRIHMNALSRFQGAVGKVMWTEIKDALNYWLDPSRLDDGLVWDDPSHLTLPMVLLWLDFFLRCQTGEIPPERRFQFLRVPVGDKFVGSLNRQETGREEREVKGRLTTIHVFEQTVTKCQHPEGMDYSDDSLRYAEFVNTGLEPEPEPEPFDAPKSWMDLPIPGPDVPDSVISDTERATILSRAELLLASERKLIEGSVNAAVEHQEHLPALHPLGVYASKYAPPKAIPPSHDSNSWSTSMWADPDYYRRPSEASPEGTVEHMESWQHDQRQVLRHEPSGTLYGGRTGVIRVLRPLIELLFNFAAVRGDFVPPEPAPADYDLTRLPINEWPRLLQWIRDWTADIQASTAILRRTSNERRQGLAALQSLTDDDEPAPRNPTPGPSSSRAREPVPTGSSAHSSPNETSQSLATAKPTSNKSRKRQVPKPTQTNGKDKGKGRARDSSDDEDVGHSSESEDGQNSREINFEELDRTSQDEMSDEEHGLMGDLGPEPDDIFPPTDPIGLRAKYGYDSYLPRKTVEGTGPSSFSGKYAPTDFPMGTFADFLAHVPSRISTPDTLAKHLIAFNMEAKRVKDQYMTFGADNPKYPTHLIGKCVAASKLWAPVQFQPIFHWLFVIQAIWTRAQALAPLAFEHHKAIGYVLREGLQLQTVAESFLAAGNFPDPLTTPTFIENLVRDSKKLTVEFQWVLESLIEWNLLSASYFNKLKGALFYEWPSTLGEAAMLCKNTLEWYDETFQLYTKLCVRFTKLWKGQLLPKPLKGDPHISLSDIYFTFGSPYIEDLVPPQLRDNLEHLQHDLDNREIVNEKLEELTTSPAASTSSPDDNPPPTTPAPTTTNAPQTSTASTTPGALPAPTAINPAVSNVEVTAPTSESTATTAEPGTETAGVAGTATHAPDVPSRLRRPRPRPPPVPESQLVTNKVATTPTDGGDALSSGPKRKRDPSSPKEGRRASPRIQGQTKAKEGTEVQPEAQADVATANPPPRVTRARSNAQEVGPETQAAAEAPPARVTRARTNTQNKSAVAEKVTRTRSKKN